MTRRQILILVLLFAIALAARLFDLRADPPPNFAGGGQDLTTDGPYLTLYARNAVLFGAWSPLGFETWGAFKISIVSGLSYVLFRLFGSSLVTSNLAGAILNLGALILFILALRKYLRPRGLLLAATFMALSFELNVYGRLPLAENGMLFLIAAGFVVFSFWFDRIWGKVLLGVLVAICGLLGKSFGFLVAAGPLMHLIIYRKKGDVKAFAVNLAWFVVPLVLVSGVVLFLTQGKGSFLSFLWEYGVEEHGSPRGFQSVADYFESLISFARTGLHQYAPIVSLIAYVTLFRLVAGGKWGESVSKLLTFMVSWIVIWVIALSPFNYQPTRYLFVLYVPIAVLAAVLLDNLSRVDLPPVRFRSVWRLALLQLLNWYSCFVVIHTLFMDSLKPEIYLQAVWYALSASLALTLIQVIVIRAWRFMIPVRFHKPAIAIALTIFLATEGRQYVEWISSRTYTLCEASDDLAAVVESGAVIAGQYGPALASNTSLQSFPYFVTADISGMLTRFKQYPVTHVAVSASEWNPLCQEFPQLKAAPVVGTYWLRDNVVYLVRIAGITGNPTASQYPRSEYEIAIDYERAGLLDSAQMALAGFLRTHPLSKSGLTEKYYVDVERAASHDLASVQPLIDTLLARYGTDFSVCVMGSAYYKWLGENSGNQKYRDLSLQYLSDAVKHNRHNEQNLRDRYSGFRPGTRVLH